MNNSENIQINTKTSSTKCEVDSILFLNKMLFDVKIRYWLIELEMTELMWTIRRIFYMIKSSILLTIIYTDNEVNTLIVATTKLSTININKLNMKFIRVSIYLSQFRLDIRHRSRKFNIVSNAISRLSIKSDRSLNDSLNLNFEHFDIALIDSENDQIYAYSKILIEMFKKFRTRIIDEYFKKENWTHVRDMLNKLEKNQKHENSKENIEVNFQLRNELIYHIKNKNRLCISKTCEKDIFQQAHDKNNHSEHHKTYQRIANSIYISSLLRKIRRYIKFCSSCELNQTKKHASYEKLISISTECISFKTIVMNFIVTLSDSRTNFILTVTCKIFKRVSIIFEMINWKTFQ